METATIYANYGVLAHEYETVWGLRPDAQAKDADRVTVALPDGYRFVRNGYGITLIEDDEGNTAPFDWALATISEDPVVYVPDGDRGAKRVPLIIVDRTGWTIW